MKQLINSELANIHGGLNTPNQGQSIEQFLNTHMTKENQKLFANAYENLELTFPKEAVVGFILGVASVYFINGHFTPESLVKIATPLICPCAA